METDFYFKRKIKDGLLKWKENPRHVPLIIQGLGQIGNTKTVTESVGKNLGVSGNKITSPHYLAPALFSKEQWPSAIKSAPDVRT